MKQKMVSMGRMGANPSDRFQEVSSFRGFQVRHSLTALVISKRTSSIL